MLGLIYRLLLPVDSRRRNRLKNVVERIKGRRTRNFRRQRYAQYRYAYYEHLVVAECDSKSLISIVIPCFNTPVRYFEELLASVFAQSYPNWELVLADASTSKDAELYLKSRAQSDTRIIYKKIKNKGIAANTNEAITLASGDYIAFMDHDDTLDPNALAETLKMFEAYPELTIVYSDEDKITDDGREYFDPHFKPGFSLDLLRNVNYINHLTTVRADFLRKVEGIREGFDGAQDFDFLLRAFDAGAKFGHVQKVLYHWRQAEGSTASDFSNKKHITDAGCRALDEHYKRNNIRNAKAVAIPNRPGFYTADFTLEKNMKRSIVVNLNEYDIPEAEATELLNHYKRNEDVIKRDIQVFSIGDAPSNSDTVCVINGPFIPVNNNVKISDLFAVAELPGVSGVSPKIVRHGKIYDMGIVADGPHVHSLFKDLDPSKPFQFGSIEWVRNVNKLTGNVTVRTNARKTENRNVIWSHVEFVAFGNSDWHKLNDPYAFSNQNITVNIEVVEDIDDFVSDLIEVKK